MKKLISRTSFVFLLFTAILTSCTQNQRARSFGGNEIVKLPEHNILINSTWKQDNLWILTKDTLTGKLYFRESSSFGLLEGSIEFK